MFPYVLLSSRVRVHPDPSRFFLRVVRVVPAVVHGKCIADGWLRCRAAVFVPGAEIRRRASVFPQDPGVTIFPALAAGEPRANIPVPTPGRPCARPGRAGFAPAHMASSHRRPFVAFLASLRWKLLGWFFLNLALLGAALFVFLRMEFGLELDSLLGGTTGNRLQTIAQTLAAELRQRPTSAWGDALARVVGPRVHDGRVHTAIVDDHANVIAGSLPPLPANVRRALVRPAPPAEKGRQNLSNAHPGNFDEFLVTSDDPRLYWAGVYLQNVGAPDAPPRYAALVFASATLHGGGLFFNYTGWALLGLGLLGLSVGLWVPFIRRLTRGLTDMTRAAERIAEGRFEPPRVSARADELGRLGRALAHMAARLEGHVAGQKRFLGDTAHELLSPLARLEVALSIMEARHGEIDPAMVERSLAEVRHLARIVQDLLLFTKSELRASPVVLTDVPLAGLARAVARREAAGEVQVRVDIAENLRARADHDLLDRALGNAVRNAVRYAGHAGPVTIFAASAEHAPTEVRLTVFDEGPGAPAAALEKLFDPFFRPDTARTRETGGTGLGLAIVKSCVEACGGSVSASNRTRGGLAVTFRLNRAVENARA